MKEREEEGRAAGGGGGGGRYCPHPAPAGSPPTRIPRAWHRRVVPGGPVLFGHHRGAAAHSPLKAAGRAGDPLPGPTEGSKGGLRPAPPPSPRAARPGPIGCWGGEWGEAQGWGVRGLSVLAAISCLEKRRKVRISGCALGAGVCRAFGVPWCCILKHPCPRASSSCIQEHPWGWAKRSNSPTHSSERHSKTNPTALSEFWSHDRSAKP